MENPDVKLEVVTVPVYDTGLGREAGYASDAALIVAYEAERLALTEPVREIVDKVNAEMTRRFVGGA